MGKSITYYHVVRFTDIEAIAIKAFIDKYLNVHSWNETKLIINIRNSYYNLRNFKLLHDTIYFTTKGSHALDIVVELCKEINFQFGIETDAKSIVACDNGDFYRCTITTFTDAKRIRPIDDISAKDEKLRLNIIYSFRKLLVCEGSLIKSIKQSCQI